MSPMMENDYIRIFNQWCQIL